MAGTNTNSQVKNPDTTAPEKRDGATENPQRADQSNKDIGDAERAESEALENGAGGVTETQDAKTDIVSSLVGKPVGDHFAQRFANAPENPKAATHLSDVDEGNLVRMEITDSDHPDPANPKVAMVHPDMVGDYRRAGWRSPDA